MATKKSVANYTVEIEETSLAEMSAKDRIKMKEVSDATKLDIAVTEDEALIISPVAYAILNIHNEKSDDKDYKNYIILDKDGNKYVTGSESFWNSFINIFNELDGSGEEWELKIFRMPSKNYSGKTFITCAVA